MVVHFFGDEITIWWGVVQVEASPLFLFVDTPIAYNRAPTAHFTRGRHRVKPHPVLPIGVEELLPPCTL